MIKFENGFYVLYSAGVAMARARRLETLQRAWPDAKVDKDLHLL